MHCPICDKDSASVTLVKDCADCQEAIQDCLDGYPKEEEEDEADDVLEEGWNYIGC